MFFKNSKKDFKYEHIIIYETLYVYCFCGGKMYPGTIHPLWVFLLFSCWIQSTKSCWELSTVLAFLRDALPIKIGIHYMVLTTGLGRANGHRLHVYQSIWFFFVAITWDRTRIYYVKVGNDTTPRRM